MKASELIERYKKGERNFRGANLLRASLQGACLQGADLQGACLPSPTMVLLAYWGPVPAWLCVELMRYDASNHENPESFEDWASGGPCPYTGSRFERAANFREQGDLYSPGPALSALYLAQWLIQIKTQQGPLVRCSLAKRGLL